jgi:hypothetical protein
MAEATDTTQTALDQLTERLVLLADKIAENAGPAGEAAWNVTMTALRIEAIAYLGTGVIAAIVTLALVRGAIGQLQKVEPAPEHSYRDFARGSGKHVVGVIVCSAGAFITGCATFATLLNVPYWVTAVSPEAGLALRIINGL